MADKDDTIELRGPSSIERLELKSATISEGLSKLTRTRIQFLAKSRTLDLSTVVGKSFTVELGSKDEDAQKFSGLCISAENLGVFADSGLYEAEIRPWLWFLTRGQNSRIFQAMSVVDIIEEVLGDYGFASDIINRLSESYKPRTYCVQYRESDFDFLSRLMEEEGIYYFFEPDDDTEKLVLIDSSAAHTAVSGLAKIPYSPDKEHSKDTTDRIYDWHLVERVTPGKVTLSDYDPRQPKADQKKVKAMPHGQHSHKDYEIYDYPAHMRDMKNGEALARVMMEANAAPYQIWHGTCNLRNLRVGQSFTLQEHPIKAQNQDYLFIDATHVIRSAAEADLTGDQRYQCEFHVIPLEAQYRAPQVTPWPEIAGLQTAIVTGPGGDEIYTDEYGRIKVKFHWDRVGGNDENSSCWVRTVMPWTGKSWGMIAIPRIGQEVVIQFEEGDPDRPICTGMLYNADTMPPYELPAEQTKSGVKTRSTKEGNSNTFHELVFEDKKGDEFIHFQSERNYRQTIKNNAVITIGHEHAGPGDLRQHVKRNQTDLTGLIRTHVTLGLEDLNVGGIYDEAVGVIKSQFVGMNKSETIGWPLTGPAALDLLTNLGSASSSWFAEGKYSDVGAAMTSAVALAGARGGSGKFENIFGTSSLEVTGDRKQVITKGRSGKNGDLFTKIEDGNHIISVLKGDRQVGVAEGDLITGVDKGDYRVTVAEKNHLTSVLKGDKQVGVEKGKLIVGVDTDNYETTVSKGDFKLKASGGKIKMEAMQEIELKVGQSVIKLTPTGIEIKGTMIKSEATGVHKIDGATTTVGGDLVLISGGPVVSIN